MSLLIPPSGTATRGWAVAPLVALLFALLATPPAIAADSLRITEFMADNNTFFNDEDGNNSDWIELHNEGTTAVNLGGWYLTDTRADLRRWQFPATNLAASGYLVVFASDQNRRTPGAPLHTNFKLSNTGEYLALVAPDGSNVVSEFAPAFPLQAEDVSYGTVRPMSTLTLVETGATIRVLVPTDDSLGRDWTEVEFDDAGWREGTTGVGYDRQTIGVNYLPLIGLNVEADLYNRHPTLYARLAFNVANPAELAGLNLHLAFEDGVVAYLNGMEVVTSNAPATPAWNSAAAAPRTDVAATNWVDFNLSAERGFLVAGPNVLAFQALNVPVNSPDLLLLPRLTGTTATGEPVPRYFTDPTPGQPNNPGVVTLGPLISQASHEPPQPAAAESLVITARLSPLTHPVATVELHYRAMFGAETTVPMLDDGLHDDGLAGDRVYGAAIPGGLAAPDQMVRWYITAVDNTGTNHSRLPPFTDPERCPAYFGTVIAPAAGVSRLPVFHWFLQNPAAADQRTGTRCSVFYNGEFYDNVFCRVRGASAPSFPKKPYKFDFNPGYHFRLFPDQPRMDEINLNTTYQDKAYVRQPLTFETYRLAGVPACDAFNVRIQQNGSFYSIAAMIEQVDETFLERRNLSPQGALYKIFNGLDSALSGVEKKTRRSEGNSDLQQLVNAVSRANPNRDVEIFDMLNLPEIVNYLAAGTVAQDWDRVIKNIYVYRDTEGTGQWQMFPWDKDLSFGEVGLLNDTLTGTRDLTATSGAGEPYISHPFYGIPERNCCGMNHLFDAVYKTPATREMYLRRLRTLMDELLQPPGTPADELKYERRLVECQFDLEADAALDLAKWGAGYGQLETLDVALQRLRDWYLAPRRTHLYLSHSIDSVGIYPEAVGIPHAQTGIPPIQFGAVDFNPASANQQEEFVELTNPTPLAVDLSGWQVTGGIEFTFAPGTVLPSHGRLHLARNVAAFLQRAAAPHGGQGRFVVGNYQGQLSARGETLRLLDAAGRLVSTNLYPGDPSPAQQFLRLTELMYHPAPPSPGEPFNREDFEFVELQNLSPDTTLDLAGVRFIDGIEFDFTGSAVTTLAPGARVVVVRNAAAFAARYGTAPAVAGTYTGALDNAGERLRLVDATNEEILDFQYRDGWHPITDGHGFSLAVVDALAEPDRWNDPANWRPNGQLLGTPGLPDPAPAAFAPIRVNEVLSASALPPLTDYVELCNPTDQHINIGGWFLTDEFDTPKKFRIPDNTLIPAGGFVVLTETDFNPQPGVAPSFAFSSAGEEVYLFSADAESHLSGYLHGFTFGAAMDGVSFGVHATSTGEHHFVAQAARTPLAPNAAPAVGPVVISEIMYHPPTVDPAPAGSLEYVELSNLSAEPVPLYDPASPAHTWRLRGGVDWEMPPGVILEPQAAVLVVGFDPATDAAALDRFRAAYGTAADLHLLGPLPGQFSNDRDTVRLQRPGTPDAGTVPFIEVDTVRYEDQAPWPEAADGRGSSLQRLTAGAYGNDPTNWFAAGRSPGAPNILNLIPQVSLLSPVQGAEYSQPAHIGLIAEATDPDGAIVKVEFFDGRTQLGEALAPPFTLVWSNAPAGVHRLSARAVDDRFATAECAPVEVTVRAGPPQVSLTSPAHGAVVLADSVLLLAAAASDTDGFITKVEFFAGTTKLGEAEFGPFTFAWTNPPTGTHILSVVATDNADLTAVADPVTISVVAGFADALPLVQAGSTWSYFDGGLDLGTAWQENAFDDSTWASGPAPLGYGDGDEATVVGYGPDGNNKFITTYFRHGFLVAHAAAFTELNLRVLRDDGAVVYLNGTEVFRTGMPDGNISHLTRANVTTVGADESTNFHPTTVDPALLREGVNLLAVEVHQVLPTSSDISFDLDLAGARTFFAPQFVRPLAHRTAPVGSNLTWDADVAGTPPLHYQWLWNGTEIPGASQATLTLTDLALAHGGAYSLQVTNLAGTALSQPALLGVTVANDYAQTVRADLPIHYYRFEETSSSQPAADQGQPGDRPGTYTGGITLGHPNSHPGLGHAAWFNGAPGTFVNLALFHPGNTTTIEAWVNLDPDARAGSYHAIIARWDGSYELDLATDDRANLVVRNQVSALGLVPTPNAVPRGQWHHLVGIYHAGFLQLYLNGLPGDPVSLAGSLRNGGPAPDRVLIGATRDGAASSFNWKGFIDEVAVYNYALPPERIFAHYQLALPPPTLSLTPDGQLRWPALGGPYRLEVTATLDDPASWQEDPSPRTAADGYVRVTLSLTSGTRFYRLTPAPVAPGSIPDAPAPE